jgi:hypothetical protein
MPLDIRKPFMTALLLLPLPGWSTTVNRCEDASGSVTFTTLGCPHGHSVTQQEADNAMPGTVIPSPEPPSREPFPTPQKELVVVGQHDDGCANVLTAEQRRRAIINMQTPTGMTKRDVESLLGKPDKIISRNAEIRYVYKEKKGRSRQVSFDENGCVKGKR